SLSTFFLSLIFFGIPYFVSFFKEAFLGYSIYGERYLIFSVILIKIYIAHGLERLFTEGNLFFSNLSIQNKFVNRITKPQNWLGLAILGLLFAATAFNSLLYMNTSNFYESEGNYRDTVSFIQQNSDQPMPVLIETSFTKKAFRYYFDQDWHPYLIGVRFKPSITGDLFSLANNSDSFWYAMAHSRDTNYVVLNWSKDHGYLDQNIGVLEFSKIILFKCDRNKSIIITKEMHPDPYNNRASASNNSKQITDNISRIIETLLQEKRDLTRFDIKVRHL
ncbi:MAG: hypothetical protein ACFFBD_29275, partial [Candidatus Hodarchaeota archaeon]